MTTSAPTMLAALVTDFNQPPAVGEFAAPAALAGEILLRPTAAALSQLVRAKASGRHYSSDQTLPAVPGVDGVGITPDGERVFFAFPRSNGSMAQQVAVARGLCVPVPDELDDIAAAALGNPAMSSVAALRYRAGFQPGDNVLINGAAGTSGRLAIQLARHMGAGHIIATARSAAVESELRALGADAFVNLNQSETELTAAFAEALTRYQVDIVLDYLWGAPAACLLNAIPKTPKPLRFVNIGSLAGADIALNAGILRSKNLMLSGSGLGSVSNAQLMQAIADVMQWAVPAGLSIATRAMPLSEVTQAWHYQGPERLVLTIG
ncbi:quinone oxidoreductase family protein [Thalassolituus sp. LLYu03]|uniref:quinone oxidoreductase family protein n=1 Tax=Thalassolituus sp. LLYu03 TaxID=3421656 RepID=UPI003D278A12